MLTNPYYLYASQLINLCLDEFTQMEYILSSSNYNSGPASFALNLWSPYISNGRISKVIYPTNQDQLSVFDNLKQKGIETDPDNLGRAHKRYIKLLGRNASINHYIIENSNVYNIHVDTTSDTLHGPTPNADPVEFKIPLYSNETNTQKELVSYLDISTALLSHLFVDEFESKYEGRFREIITENRMNFIENVEDIQFDEFSELYLRNEVLSGTSKFDAKDGWARKVQLAVIASKIWGQRWVTKRIEFENKIWSMLNVTASTTVACHCGANLDSPKMENLIKIADEWTTQFHKILANKIESLDINQDEFENKLGAWKNNIINVSNSFFMHLGNELIGSDHEGKPLSLRALITEGIDTIPAGPSNLKILYEFKQDDFPSIITSNQLEYFFKKIKPIILSNAFLLSRPNIYIQFEWELINSGNDISEVIIKPRSIIYMSQSAIELFEDLDDRNIHYPGCLRSGFEAGKEHALYFGYTLEDGEKIKVSTAPKISSTEDFSKIQLRKKTWNDWSVVASLLYTCLCHMKTEFVSLSYFSHYLVTFNNIENNQLINLCAGIAEVCRLNRGCLVFLGPTHQKEDSTLWLLRKAGKFENPDNIQITRLGTSWKVVPNLPTFLSNDFCSKYADMSGLDGETIICCPLYKNGDTEPDSTCGISTGCFTQPPSNTQPLIHPTKPDVNDAYKIQWNEINTNFNPNILPQLSHYYDKLELPGFMDKVEMNTISNLEPSKLLSFGTRHRKASTISMLCEDTLAITCSESGPIRIWLGGIPIVEIISSKAIMIGSGPNPKEVESIYDKYTS
ncbi:MAG: hypothetical protein KOO62_05450 [candidate division Zixibacteria bacterium]|nr:hypothetical protein [candidate division Zixibacteria bacterium]